MKQTQELIFFDYITFTEEEKVKYLSNDVSIVEASYDPVYFVLY